MVDVHEVAKILQRDWQFAGYGSHDSPLKKAGSTIAASPDPFAPKVAGLLSRKK
jgi:hypothetical protein